eukprot:5207898-Amphidinium_carterae.1
MDLETSSRPADFLTTLYALKRSVPPGYLQALCVYECHYNVLGVLSHEHLCIAKPFLANAPNRYAMIKSTFASV